ncbi:uncharacterized protein LOC127842448 [Dreissena polymorpha]|uniref:uncharacterized protein LOC127842448 n=1 Tax=Dreissena polymorpha TaxID=45954 RepID=UPI002263D78A|nr:uncharacterized protein LOC127842448 [Dreissena polymorpha]
MYEIISQFGRRGYEGLHTLTKSAFTIKTDINGKRYFAMTYNEADKTHHGLDNKEKMKDARMYETSNEFCPLKSFEKYLSKLNPECDRLFQRPARVFLGDTQEFWFEKAPLGINTINSFMPNLSVKANLSKRYTNHCIRAFVSTHLHGQGFSNAAIMSVTGHRNVQSLTSYVKPQDEEKRTISNALAYKGASCEPALSSPLEISTCSASSDSYNHAWTESDQLTSSTASNLNLLNTFSQSKQWSIFSGAINSSTININIHK